MRKIICLVMCLGILAIGFTAIADHKQSGILNYCLDISNDPVFCIRCQYEAINNILSKYQDSTELYINSLKSAPTGTIVNFPPDVKIITTCMDKYKLKKYNTHDWVRVDACCDFLSKVIINNEDTMY